MSRFDYDEGKRIAKEGAPFYALIQAAMRQADSINAAKLRVAWPEVWAELQARYEAPGGNLPGDGCDLNGPYFVFHGVSRSRRPEDHVYPSSGTANTTVIGHGATRSEALEDAERHELERGPGGYTFDGIAHVSGPHQVKR